MGTRIPSQTKRHPKAFIRIEGIRLIERSLSLLRAAGFARVVICTGFLSEWFEELKGAWPEVECVKNVSYATTGSLQSLICLRESLTDDFLLLESDLLYEKRAITLMQELSHSALLVSGETQAGDEVYVDENADHSLHNLTKVRGDIHHYAGEFVGINRLHLQEYKAVCDWFDRNSPRSQTCHYEEGLVGIGKVTKLSLVKVSDLIWTEIDMEEHLRRAETVVLPKLRGEFVKRNILLNPGPATTTDSVKQALCVPDICPREEEFCEVVNEVRQGLRSIAHGDQSYVSVPFAASGTGAVEACLSSVLKEGEKILIHSNGAYGLRMEEIASTYYGQKAVVSSEEPFGNFPDLNRLESYLKKDPSIRYLAFVHHETTTGMLNPAKQFLEVAQKYGVRVIVDAMSSFAGIPMDLRDTPFDFVISSANKCLEAMAGISFVLCKKEALEKLAQIPPRNVYLNLYRQWESLEKTGQMQFTPPVQVFYALRQAIKELAVETVERRYKRYTGSWDVLQKGLQELNLVPLLPLEHQSKLLTAIREPAEFNFKEMHDVLYKKGFTIYPGKIPSNRTFRIANIGAITSRDMEAFVAELRHYLNSTSG